MRAAYLDTSVLVGIAFGEPGAAALARGVRGLDALFSATLLESEFLAVAARENVLERLRPLLEPIRFVHPARRLTPEDLAALRHGRLRGADLHHLSTALYVFPRPEEAFFLTLDAAQGAVAARLGFRGRRDL
jgi:predicted nucleic acid-binding protein